jgi:hypothetical protein
MNAIWTLNKGFLAEYNRASKKKVCNVSEVRSGTGVVSWKGDLDDGNYFAIVIIDGIISAAFAEREFQLDSAMKTIAYSTLLEEVVSAGSDFLLMSDLMSEILPDIQKFMSALKFEDMMEFFKWKYATDKIQVYEYNQK